MTLITQQICVLASHNQHKLKELQQLLPFKMYCASDFNIESCDEPYATFIENALHKARHVAKHLPENFKKAWVLADDSGLCVPALSGSPGIYSARWASMHFDLVNQLNLQHLTQDAKNNALIINQLTQLNNSNHQQTLWNAYYVCLLVLIKYENDPNPIIASGYLHGQLQKQTKGEHGFGYDPHMYLKKLDKTVAMLTDEEKNSLSHRAIAIKNLLNMLNIF